MKLLRRLRFGIENVALGILYVWPVKRWRRRIKAIVGTKLDTEFHAWRKTQPDRCEICAHTRWAREQQGVELEMTAHDCPDGTTFQLPEARVIQ